MTKLGLLHTRLLRATAVVCAADDVAIQRAGWRRCFKVSPTTRGCGSSIRHPSRRAMRRDLASALGMKRGRLEQLQRLSDLGILASRRDGNNIYYRLVDRAEGLARTGVVPHGRGGGLRGFRIGIRPLRRVIACDPLRRSFGTFAWYSPERVHHDQRPARRVITHVGIALTFASSCWR